MAVYVCREGETATATAWANLTTLGGETRNAVIVPPGMNRIVEIWASPNQNIWTDVKGALVAGKLTGSGIGAVTYEFLCGGFTTGTITTSGAKGFARKAMVLKTNLAVTPGGEIWCQMAHVTAATAGTIGLAMTLVFDSGGGESRWSFVRQGAVTSVDTKTALTLNPIGGTETSIWLPQKVHHITNLVTAIGGITIGATAKGGTAFVRLEGGLTEGIMEFGAGGHGAELTTTGACSGVFIPDPIATDITVVGGSIIAVSGEVCGTDWGDPIVGVSVEVA